MIILLCLVYCLVFGCLCKDLKNKKGYDDGFWIGFFFGIIALIYCAGLPKNNTQEQPDNPEDDMLDVQGKDFIYCKHCGYPIYNDENECKNCGHKK